MTILTQDLTFQLGDNGVLLNQDTVSLPFVDIISVAGLDSPPFRESIRDHEGVDGGFIDAEFEQAREIVLQGTIYADPSNMETFLDSLRLNYQPVRTPIPFYFLTNDVGERVVFVKSRGVRYDWTTLRRTGCADVQFLLYGEDPRIYSSTQHVVPVALGSTVTNGRGFNKSYNFGYSTILSIPDGSILTNGGNREAPATIDIAGPVTSPVIINDTTGDQLLFNTTLGVGEVLTVDLANHTVVLNGSTNRRNTLDTPDWFLLQPGDNLIRYRAASSPPGTATFTWRDTWR